jgi:hypothetical protein
MLGKVSQGRRIESGSDIWSSFLRRWELAASVGVPAGGVLTQDGYGRWKPPHMKTWGKKPRGLHPTEGLGSKAYEYKREFQGNSEPEDQGQVDMGIPKLQLLQDPLLSTHLLAIQSLLDTRSHCHDLLGDYHKTCSLANGEQFMSWDSAVCLSLQVPPLPGNPQLSQLSVCHDPG